MARILITGSSDGLGSFAAQKLVKQGHSVVLHARSAQRAKDAQAACPEAETCVVGDLSNLGETKALASKINELGSFDAVIHNAGLYITGWKPTPKEAGGLPSMVAVNTFAPYILTSLISPPPKRLAFLSSGLHSGSDGDLSDVTWSQRGEKGWSDAQAYAETKLHNILLANYFARKWKGQTLSNSIDPGWVATKMGGASATTDINQTAETYLMLALGEGQGETATGKYFTPGKKEDSPVKVTGDEKVQDELIRICEEVTGVKIPA